MGAGLRDRKVGEDAAIVRARAVRGDVTRVCV